MGLALRRHSRQRGSSWQRRGAQQMSTRAASPAGPKRPKDNWQAFSGQSFSQIRITSWTICMAGTPPRTAHPPTWSVLLLCKTSDNTRCCRETTPGWQSGPTVPPGEPLQSIRHGDSSRHGIRRADRTYCAARRDSGGFRSHPALTTAGYQFRAPNGDVSTTFRSGVPQRCESRGSGHTPHERPTHSPHACVAGSFTVTTK